MNNTKKIYLDYAATTPCDPAVLQEMLPYFTEHFGNAGSKNHEFGWEAEEAVERARAQVAAGIGAQAKQIIFTSGATESNNIAIRGLGVYIKKNYPNKMHAITLLTEHKCVLASFGALEELGFEITYLEIQPNGLVDLEKLAAAIREETMLVSVAWVHNEIGVIQPIQAIGALCKARGVAFHVDAAQAVGKIPIDVHANNIDLLSISGHKVYAPKGIGALYIRPGVRLGRIVSGGGQERGLRSGTLPVPLCVGLGKAIEVAEVVRESEHSRMKELQSYMLGHLQANLEDIYLNGDLEQRIPHNLNISFAYIEGESFMMKLNGIALSSGSACTSGSLEPSYVITALGTDEMLVHSAIRMVFGKYTTLEEVQEVAERIVQAVQDLRSISPLWYLKQQGQDLKAIQWVEH